MNIVLHNKTRKQLLREIEFARNLGNLKFLNRLQFILFLTENVSYESLAIAFCITVRTVYNWITLFLTKGINGLHYKFSGGKKPRLNSQQKKELKKLILKGPEESEYKTGSWTCALIQDLIYEKYQVEYSVKYISQLMAQMNLVHKKSDSVSYKADKKKQQEWEKEILPALLEKMIKEGSTLLYQDESTFLMWSRKAYSWGEKGKKLEVKLNMSGIFQKVFGAIELSTGKLIYRLTGKEKNAKTFLDYLKYLVSRYNGQKVYLVIDNAPIHKGPKIRKYLEENSGKIELCRLPSYSPILNPIEKVWKNLKLKKMHNRFFKNEKEFLSTLRGGLKKLQKSPGEVLKPMKKWYKIYCELKCSIEQREQRWNYVKALLA